MWKFCNSPKAEAPCFSWWGHFCPSSFYNYPEKSEYSWSKLLWIFNINLSPLEQNLFPGSANPRLFLPPLGFSGVGEPVWKGSQLPLLTVNSPLQWEIKEACHWRQLGGEGEILPTTDGSEVLWWGGLSPFLPWLCAGTWQDIPRGDLNQRYQALHAGPANSPVIPVPQEWYRNSRGSNLKEPWGLGSCGLWAADTVNPTQTIMEQVPSNDYDSISQEVRGMGDLGVTFINNFI